MHKSWTFRAALASACLAFAAISVPASAAVPIGGLTVAVSGDGTKLVAGGNTRTILVLDPDSLDVKARHWIGASIVDMAFNKDGSVLAVMDTSATVYLYDTKTWKAKFTLQKRDKMTVYTGSDILAGYESNYRGGLVHLNSMKDGSNIGQIKLQPKERVAAMGFSADGKKLAVLLQGEKSPDEPEVRSNDIPKDLRGIAREDFRMHNDGRVSTYRVFEVPSGKQLSESKTFFTLNSGQIAVDDKGMTILGYSRHGLRINVEGKGNLFTTQNSFNYGLGLSPDGSLWLSGGLANYSLTANPALTNKGKGRLDRLPSWPEYFKGFSATADNKTIYGATTAYRVVKIGGDGKLIKAAPVR